MKSHELHPRPRAAARFLAVTILAGGAFLACQRADPPPDAEVVQEAGPKISSDFRLATVDGRTLGPPDFKGQVVLLDFWATWCGPCHAQAEILKPLYQEMRAKGVQFLAVDLEETQEEVLKFIAKNPFPYPVLLDPDGEVSYKMGIFALPTLAIIDRDGKVVYVQQGLTDRPTLQAKLSAAGAA